MDYQMFIRDGIFLGIFKYALEKKEEDAAKVFILSNGDGNYDFVEHFLIKRLKENFEVDLLNERQITINYFQENYQEVKFEKDREIVTSKINLQHAKINDNDLAYMAKFPFCVVKAVNSKYQIECLLNNIHQIEAFHDYTRTTISLLPLLYFSWKDEYFNAFYKYKRTYFHSYREINTYSISESRILDYDIYNQDHFIIKLFNLGHHRIFYDRGFESWQSMKANSGIDFNVLKSTEKENTLNAIQEFYKVYSKTVHEEYLIEYHNKDYYTKYHNFSNRMQSLFNYLRKLELWITPKKIEYRKRKILDFFF